MHPCNWCSVLTLVMWWWPSELSAPVGEGEAKVRPRSGTRESLGSWWNLVHRLKLESSPAELHYKVNRRKPAKLEKPGEEIGIWKQISSPPAPEFDEEEIGARGFRQILWMELPWCSQERRAEAETSSESQVSLLDDALTGLKNTDVCIEQTIVFIFHNVSSYPLYRSETNL